MNNPKNQQGQTPSLSSLTEKRKHNELVVIEYELNEIVNKKIKKLQKNEKTLLPVSDPHEEVKESDGLFVAGLSASIGSHMKNAALCHQPKFKLLDTDNQSIVSLGLNSIIDLSFDHPEAQSTLFTGSQWKELKKSFPPKTYQIEKHDDVKKHLKSIIASYQGNRSWGPNWLSMYRKTKSLQNRFDIEENQDYDKEDFCLFFVELVLKLIKHHQYLFQEGIDVSEWDYICKLWSPVMEKLFAQSGLRLKWGDTKLSLNDIGPNNDLKVDLRILNDEAIQFVNHETDSGVLEAAKSDPGSSKYQSDHCKLMVECKSIIDMYINKGHNLDTVDCIQICGLEILILNLSLSAPGVYVANEIYHGSILGSLSQMDKMLDIALNLLSFKTAVIEIKNKYVQQKRAVENSKRSIKSKKYNKGLKEKSLKADKKTWTRGTWVAFRDGKTEIPPPPSKLTA